MAKKKRRRRRTTSTRYRKRRKRTLAIAPLAGLAAGIAAPSAYGYSVLDGILEGNFNVAALRLFRQYTGVDADGKFEWDIKSAYGLWELVAGVMAHKAANWLGVNRTFNNLPAPLDRLRI